MTNQKKQPIQYMNSASPDTYRYVISEQTLEKIKQYLQKINSGGKIGTRLLDAINHDFTPGDEYDPRAPLTQEIKAKVAALEPADFLQLLMNTRQPTIFAESAGARAVSNGEWTHDEYHILEGVMSVVHDVKVFDDGTWGNNAAQGEYENDDYRATLLAVPGAILDPRLQSTEETIQQIQNAGNTIRSTLQLAREELTVTADKKAKQIILECPSITLCAIIKAAINQEQSKAIQVESSTTQRAVLNIDECHNLNWDNIQKTLNGAKQSINAHDKATLHYAYFSQQGSQRFHARELTPKTLSHNLDQELKQLHGDALKSRILARFRTMLEHTAPENIDRVVADYKQNSNEYKILQKGQGLWTHLFKSATSSMKAVDKICEEVKKIKENESTAKPLKI